MNALTTSDQTPITLLVELQGLLWGDVLAVRFADAGQLSTLLRLARWLELRETEAPRGVRFSALTATVDLPGVRCWTVNEPFEPGDIVDGGMIVSGPVIEPDAAAGDWSNDFSVRSDGMLIVTGEHSAWAEINLHGIGG